MCSLLKSLNVPRIRPYSGRVVYAPQFICSHALPVLYTTGRTFLSHVCSRPRAVNTHRPWPENRQSQCTNAECFRSSSQMPTTAFTTPSPPSKPSTLVQAWRALSACPPASWPHSQGNWPLPGLLPSLRKGSAAVAQAGLTKRQATKKIILWDHQEEFLWGREDSVMMMLKKQSFVQSGPHGNFYSDYRSIIYRIITRKSLIMKQILNLVWHCHFTLRYLMWDQQSNKYLFCQDIKALWEAQYTSYSNELLG